MSVFAKVTANVSFPELEREVLALWQDLDAFQESNRRRERQGAPSFVFYDGPPFATGTPHYGHLLQGTIKDIVPRYWSMRGFQVERRFGWDCHGLPIEALAQKELGVESADAIRALGVDRFNEQCRKMVQIYVAEWRKTVSRMGRWVDFDNDYKTMDASFMETVWWVFKRLWDQGRVYRSHRIMPYSPKLSTPLSKFEVKDDNYKDVQDPAITIRFRLKDGKHAGASVLAWTTTPWTLLSNLALCVGPEISYVFIKDSSSGEVLLLAKDRLGAYFKQEEQYSVLEEVSGAQLVGLHYEPLLPYFPQNPNSFRILADDFVSTSDGTGIVHIAPAYGEDDYRVCKTAGITLVDPLDEECKFTAKVPEYAGQFCKDADKAIIRRLKEEGKLFHQSTIVHPYPFCDRTDAPLIYRAIDAWYVKVEDQREEMVANNQKVGWVPEAVGANRFGNWLREARDWNISRNRFWGSCLPVWVNVSDPSDCIAVGSITELETLAKLPKGSITDLHKHHMDAVIIHKDGKTYRRTPEVFDCWFESGSMPYGQVHWMGGADGTSAPPVFPANFIAEGLDQTRGWFYTLMVLGTALFKQSPFQNVIVTGIVLAEDGTKMSKSKRNYPPPDDILERIGADAMRAYLIDSPLVRGESLCFNEKGLTQIVRSVMLPYWNAVSFLTTYANVDGWHPGKEAPAVAQRPEMDRWILSILQSLISEVHKHMEGYRLYKVVPGLIAFIDDCTNWYIRSCRRRFWKNDDAADQAAAYATLYEVLTTFNTLLAPFMPFVTERVHQILVRPVKADAPASVHWCDAPQAKKDLIDHALEEAMAVVRSIVNLGRRLREDKKIKVRQPLATLTVIHRDAHIRAIIADHAARISEELNVKTLATDAEESRWVSLGIKPNFAALRQRCGPKLKAIGAALSKWTMAEVAVLEAGKSIAIEGEQIALADVLLERKALTTAAVATDGRLSVALDCAITPELELEGLARDFISAVQQERKAKDLDVADRIVLTWDSSDEKLAQAITTHSKTIADEVLATSIVRQVGVNPFAISKV